LFNIIFIIFK